MNKINNDTKSHQVSLKLFSTPEHDCNYLQGNTAGTLFVDPEADINMGRYTSLCESGYRRSGHFIYKPNCENCNACISLRIPTSQYALSRSERKIVNRNADLEVMQVIDISGDAFYALYERYINTRHKDGDMYPASKEQYTSFLGSQFDNNLFFAFYEDTILKAVAVADQLTNGLSAVYSFFDPLDDRRSLGRYCILWQILKTQELHLDYVYLGYWIKDCQKMAYKSQYRPAEILVNDRWINIT